MTLAELPLGDRPPPLPLAAFGPGQSNLVSVGSLSKLYWGGLRTGWIRASRGVIARLAAAKAAADLGSNAFQQAIVAALLRGQHEVIAKWRGEWLRDRHDALAGALRSLLPGWTWPEPEGGLTLWVRMPGPADSSAFAQAALRRGVAVVPGRLLSASGQGASGERASGEGAAGEGGGEASRHIRLAFVQPPGLLRAAAGRLAGLPGSDAPLPRLPERAEPIITGSLVAALFCLALTLLSFGRHRVMHAVFASAIISLVLVKTFLFTS
jgi:aspartate/methionine/tyrosine aminotransferase